MGFTRSIRPFLVAGPCSAETEEQTLQAALGVAAQGAQLFRAGIWKPRTRPHSFEGVGAIGLAWLQRAKQLTGLPVCTEVATAHHVEEALRHDIDVLWVGARTTVNPFAVQEIADALRGTDIPVLVKNPVNPDLELWLGAIERLNDAGIHRLAAIHRGFSQYHKSRYRNEPLWEVAVELRRRLPHLTIINDPSHIAGDRQYLLEIAQYAMNIGLDGLMLEIHPCPAQAWSDAKQQITPESLGQLLHQLTVREAELQNPIVEANLGQLRQHIDKLDFQLLETLAKRMELVREIGDFKQENNVAIVQMERWAEIYRTRLAQSDRLQLSTEFIAELLQAIHKESIRQQAVIMQQNPDAIYVSDLATKFK